MIRVFLADDHPLVREGLRRIVTDNNLIRVVGDAADGDTLLERLPAAEPDVLLLDITMPGPGFLELMGRIKSQHPRVRVLVVSMHPEATYAERALKAGAAGYLSKRQSTDELTSAILKVFAGGTYVSRSPGDSRQTAPNGLELRQNQLSAREFEVLLLLAMGKGISQIGSALTLSPKTVSTYRLRVLRKLGLQTNADLVRYAMQNELIS